MSADEARAVDPAAAPAADPATDPAADRAAVERRYRRWLKAYPGRWRQQNGDALIGTWLDAADAGNRDRPTRGEVADLVVHGLAERARVVLPSQAAVRPAAMLALGLGTALSLAALVLGELLPPYRENLVVLAELRGRPGQFSTSGPILYGAFILGAVLAVGGAIRQSRVALWMTTAVALALPPVSGLASVNHPPLGLVAALGLCALLAATGIHRSPAMVRAGFAIATLAVGGAMVGIGSPYIWGERPHLAAWGRRLEVGPWGEQLDAVMVAFPDRYQTLPFYRGETFHAVSAVIEVVVVMALAVAILGAVMLRSRHPLVAVLLVLPAALLALNRGGYWTSELTRSTSWPLLILVTLLAALAIEWVPPARRALSRT